ncbi:hypothetical protein IS481_17515 [Caldimonas thermodepolymerans]|uniref:Uncharacterized protein n=1 Tax=Caldimonas thermodepolymerans TaxID=215580 RepID=A0A2S5T0L4_9BURK|nr:hypothetical protein [Caldimonas thermodepolymerans]PPE68513.1 hypothetical protein C1702_16785 [Caldimonas thermodepolymerans]QPC31488.1 hypothetical protein IS481_17515 [Caldimonas thermodepolymerans]RDH99535.1 hypothetical protein DES46_10516 [Caldimonas thermodepolymerans]
MNATTVEVQVATRDRAPRGATILGAAVARRLGVVARLFLSGRPQATRVAHELNLLANRYQATQPREAAELRQAARAYLAAAMSR